jgi:two-component system cell cycle response regulator
MKEKVLLIDTQQSVLNPVADYFQRRGYEVEKVGENEWNLDQFAANPYTFIFYHFSSTASNQIEIIQQLASRVRMPCQVFATGPDEVPFAVKAMQSGARYYWPAPIDMTDLEALFQNGAFSADLLRVRHHREGTLLQIIKEIALTMELDGLVNILIDSAMELSGGDGGALLLVDEKSSLLTMRSIRGLSDPERRSDYFGLPERQCYEMLMERKPVFLQNIDPPIFSYNQQKVDSIIVAPIWWKEEALGELMVVKFAGSHGSFSSDDFKVLSLLSEEIAGAVHNAITHYKTKELTIKDDLTEAYNRRYFDQYLEEEFMRARRYGSHLSLIFFDVDNLKEVNVKYGHLIGSKTLQEVAHRMILTVRGIDKVVRYGGDEFCVVLPETDTQGALQVADRIRNTIASRPFRINENAQVGLTGSIGIASFPEHAASKEELIRQADRAMFVIKNQSKNAIAIAQEIREP